MHPAKTIRRNEMPFGRDIRVIPSNTVLDKGPSSDHKKGDLGVGIPIRSNATYAKLLWPLLFHWPTYLKLHQVMPGFQKRTSSNCWSMIFFWLTNMVKVLLILTATLKTKSYHIRNNQQMIKIPYGQHQESSRMKSSCTTWHSQQLDDYLMQRTVKSSSFC